jgi:hypothetical protein
MQGLGAILGGTLAQLLGNGATGVAWTVATLAVLSLAVTTALTPGLRRSRPLTQHQGPFEDEVGAEITT